MTSDGGGASIDKWTFAMVDLAGFTALTEVHGDADAADLAVAFADLAARLLNPGDRLVKPIGDAVLLASPTPAAGLALVTALFEECAKLPNFPVARAGLHHGPAVERRGDMFGAAVNLAARVAGQAAGGQVLATGPVAEVARQAGISVRGLGHFELRNVAEPHELFELDVCGHPSGAAIDPVCRMRVDPATAAGMLRRHDEDLWFCSLACISTYANSPDSFAAGAARTHQQSPDTARGLNRPER